MPDDQAKDLLCASRGRCDPGTFLISPEEGSTLHREVARELHVSEDTIKTHLLHAFAKLGVRTGPRP